MRIQVQGKKKKKWEIWKFVFIPYWKRTRYFETFFSWYKPKKKKKSYSQNSNTGGTHVKWNTCSAVKFLLSDTDRNLHLWLPRPSSTVTWGIASVSLSLTWIRNFFQGKNAEIKTLLEKNLGLMNLVFQNEKGRIMCWYCLCSYTCNIFAQCSL